MRTIDLLLTVLFAASTAIPAANALDSFDPQGTGPLYPDSASGRLNSTPRVQAYRLDGETIRVDGMLDDEAWGRAEAARGFLVWDPNRGGTPSEETVFKVAYDDEAVYFGVACLESDPSCIASQLCRRDDVRDSDVISLYIDPYYDRTTGYNFRVNPSGSKEERYVYNDGWMDRDWDAVWDARTHIDGNGWSAEFRIPFSCIRYRSGEAMTWGCNLYRYMHGRGEDTSWVTWDTDTRGFVSRFGEVTGLRGISPVRQLEFLPYVVHRTTDPALAEPDDKLDHYANLGADLRYGATADLTLNATFQPDFGQVEADPALLNLSPFETYYEEKRPFFTEGSRFFTHPDFNMFYSRRIGTGDPNSRIRVAGKLTGKTPRGVSVAALYAATDVTGHGQAHNFLKSGEQPAQYFVGRFGREFSEGAHRVNLMQTAVYRAADRDSFGDLASRDAWTSGVDFDLNFRDRDYNISGSVVGSTINPAPLASDATASHDAVYGTGGSLNVRKLGGTVRGGVSGRWETDGLDLNDVGYLVAPDEISGGGWIMYDHNSTRSDAALLKGNIELEAWANWLHAGGEGFDIDSGERVWSYGKGHPQSFSVELDGWGQLKSYWDSWFGVVWEAESTSKYRTRTFDDIRGPLMRSPSSLVGWWGFSTDHRKPFTLSPGITYWRSRSGSRGTRIGLDGRWNATSAMTYSLGVSYSRDHSDAHHLDNFANPGGGIGGVSYVFAELEQETVNLTLRADVLFSRDLSLQLYAQPYITVGDFHNPRELVRPDSYCLATPHGIPEFAPQDVHDYDFRYSAVNINMVLRWEYGPGSTFYLVYKQGRELYEDRTSALEGSRGFDTALNAGDLLDNEPENTFLAKVSYWFPL